MNHQSIIVIAPRLLLRKLCLRQSLLPIKALPAISSHSCSFFIDWKCCIICSVHLPTSVYLYIRLNARTHLARQQKPVEAMPCACRVSVTYRSFRGHPASARHCLYGEIETINLLAFFVALFFVVLHHRSCGNFLSSIAVATTFFGCVFYMLVHAFFFFAYSTHRLFLLFSWHK